MKTHKHKSEKIHHVVHKNERKLNLHEIKKRNRCRKWTKKCSS
ncbi:hypothetical protein [Clostridium massiliamazoniense]|nr:hypothetical protein [Clostridium massiliamazoniense]